MSASTPDIRLGLQKLASDAHYKHKLLFSRAQKREAWRRRLQVFSGAVTLLSGVVASFIFYNEVGDRWVQILSVGLIFLAGMISLSMDNLLVTRDTDAMFRGASEYASLRSRAMLEHELNLDNVDRMKKAVKELSVEYHAIFEKYDHLIRFSSTELLEWDRMQREEWGRTQHKE